MDKGCNGQGTHQPSRRERFDYRRLPRHHRAIVLGWMLIGALVCYFLLSRYVISATIVEGTSMEPACHEGDRHLLHRWVYLLYEPQRGEVVAIRLPGESGMIIKRIIALPGETIEFVDGGIRIDGRNLDEPYLSRTVVSYGGHMGTNVYRIEAGCYFVLGDNRSGSSDSREFGAVHRACILGMLHN